MQVPLLAARLRDLLVAHSLLAETAGAEAVEPLQNRREQPRVLAVHFVADSLELDAAMKRRPTTGPASRGNRRCPATTRPASVPHRIGPASGAANVFPATGSTIAICLRSATGPRVAHSLWLPSASVRSAAPEESVQPA